MVRQLDVSNVTGEVLFHLADALITIGGVGAHRLVDDPDELSRQIRIVIPQRYVLAPAMLFADFIRCAGTDRIFPAAKYVQGDTQGIDVQPFPGVVTLETFRREI